MGMGARTAITTIPKMGISMMTVKATKTQLLSSLFSPAFPIGAFAFSHGIETAINKGFVDSPESLKGWIKPVFVMAVAGMTPFFWHGHGAAMT